MTVIGIDPGKSGAIWALDVATKKTIAFYDVEKCGNDIDALSMVKFLSQFDRKNSVVQIEDPHPHGTENEVKTVYGGFEYGKGVGTFIGILYGMGFQNIRKVSPPVWKGYFAITSSASTYAGKKDLSIEKACYLEPEHEAIFRFRRIDQKMQRHDRAEAFLIATFCVDKILSLKTETKQGVTNERT